MPEGADSSFVMHSSRDAISNGLVHIERQVNILERSVWDDPNLAFEAARALVESVCRSILSEREIEFSDKEKLPALFKKVGRILPILPTHTSHEADVRKSLNQTLNGLHTAVQGICELRNSLGIVSHGSESARPVMESAQALLAAQAADTIVGFLYRTHIQDRTPISPEPSEYDQNDEFNEFVDENHEIVRIFDSEFFPSDILFQMEPNTYRIHLTSFYSNQEDVVGGTMEMGA